MGSRSSKAVLIAVAVFVLIAVAVLLFGDSLMDTLKSLHGGGSRQ